MTDTPMADAPQPPPADFWEQPEIKAALASRHFGRFLRVYRTSQSPQINQAEVARWLGITQGQLSKIERSSLPVTDLSKLCRWAHTLHVPADLLWFSLSPASPEEAPSERVTVEETAEDAGSDGGSHVHRRELFKVARAATAVAYTGLLASSPWQRLIDCVEHGKPVDAPTVRLIQDRTADFFNTEETVPARELLDSLTEHLTMLQAILPNAHAEQMRHELATAMGETYALTGWLFFDLKRENEAANAWRSALKIAKKTNDGALASCALGYWSYLAASRNDIAPAVRLLRQAGECVAGSTAPATRAWISARESEELAKLGDETGALRAVERAFTSYDFAQPRTERAWTAFFNTSRLGSMTVSSYTTLRHGDATNVADSLLASLSPRDNKVRAIVLTDLTSAAVQNKDYDRANTLVTDAVNLTARTETTIAKQRLLALAAALPTQQTATGELRDQILSTLRHR